VQAVNRIAYGKRYTQNDAQLTSHDILAEAIKGPNPSDIGNRALRYNRLSAARKESNSSIVTDF